MRRLIQLRYSPWSEKVRWALDHHSIVREQVEYLPMLGERALRRTLGKTSGLVTVPVLLDGDTVLTESLDIARWSDGVGSGPALFPEGAEATIVEWDAVGDEVLAASRAGALRRSATDPKAIAEGLPTMIPGPLRPLLVFVGRSAIRFLDRKYETDALDDERCDEMLRAGLERLRAAIEAGPHLVGEELTYADISMASSLQLLGPVADRYIPIGPATRARCTREDLLEEYDDLFRWRDQLYEAHRAGPRPAPRGAA